MHQVIRIICYAESPEEAREKAKDILEGSLIGEYRPFDYGTFFDEESTVSGKSRFGDKPVACLVNSEEGKKLIDEGFRFTKESFIEHLKSVKDTINKYSEEELFEEEVINLKSKILDKLENKKDNTDLIMFRHYAYCLGEYRGSNVFLYDNDGEGIKNTKHLNHVLNKWDEDKYKNLNIYVVPCDCHS